MQLIEKGINGAGSVISNYKLADESDMSVEKIEIILSSLIKSGVKINSMSMSTFGNEFSDYSVGFNSLEEFQKYLSDQKLRKDFDEFSAHCNKDNISFLLKFDPTAEVISLKTGQDNVEYNFDDFMVKSDEPRHIR